MYYVFYYDPTSDPFGEDATAKLPRPNPFDMVFYNAKNDLFDFLTNGLEKLATGNPLRKMKTRAGSRAFQEASSHGIQGDSVSTTGLAS